MPKRLLFTLALLLPCFVGFGWGFFAHKVIHQLAIYALPKQMQPFYFRHQEALVETAVRADQRRSQDPLEGPRHFIDVDVYGDSAAYTLPESWDQAVKVYSADTLRKYGIVPWHVLRLKDRLTEAFRARNADSILFYSADLGHYIADAHVPLHMSVNYDGQLTNQRGIHSLWESKLPQTFLEGYPLYSGKADYLPDPQKAIWGVVRATFPLVQPTLQQEQLASLDFSEEQKYVMVETRGQVRRYYSDAFAEAYQKRVGDMVERQLRASAQMVASFWYTSWVDAGRPDLASLLSPALTKEEKKALRQELKAWRRNELAEKNLLQATRRPAASSGE